MKTPAGYEPVAGPGAQGFARPRARAWVEGVLRSGSTLHEAASEAGGEDLLEGRGPVPVISVEGERWAVRHYFRGGAVASLLGDRYLRLGRPRPAAEAYWASLVTQRGIPTPPVLAGAIYPDGVFYRADLVTRYLPDSRDLATVLFDDPDPAFPRAEALEATGSLLVWSAEAGIYHPDVNAKNVLLQKREGELAPHLLDLDRCQADVAGIGWIEDAMVARLKRSLRKLGQASGRPLSEDDWEALAEGIHAGGSFPGA